MARMKCKRAEDTSQLDTASNSEDERMRSRDKKRKVSVDNQLADDIRVDRSVTVVTPPLQKTVAPVRLPAVPAGLQQQSVGISGMSVSHSHVE